MRSKKKKLWVLCAILIGMVLALQTEPLEASAKDYFSEGTLPEGTELYQGDRINALVFKGVEQSATYYLVRIEYCADDGDTDPVKKESNLVDIRELWQAVITVEDYSQIFQTLPDEKVFRHWKVSGLSHKEEDGY